MGTPLFFLRGVLLGLGAAMPIGPVNVEIARRTLRGGFRAGFALGCGAVTVDVVYAVLTSLSFASVMANERLMVGIGIAGGLFLAYLGCLSLWAAVHQQPIDATTVPPSIGSRGHYLTGLAMTALNPMTLLFWFVGVPATFGNTPTRAGIDLPVVGLGVFTGTIAWVCAFAGTVHLTTQNVAGSTKQRWLQAADAIGGMLLLGFAGWTIWRTAHANL